MDPYTGKCVRSPHEGCWIGVNGVCEACNPYIDYSMGENGTCYRSRGEGRGVEASMNRILRASQKLIQEALFEVGSRD